MRDDDKQLGYSEQVTNAEKVDLSTQLQGDNTSPAGEGSASDAAKNRMVVIGGTGCALLLCLGLVGLGSLLTASSFIFSSSNDDAAVEATIEQRVPEAENIFFETGPLQPSQPLTEQQSNDRSNTAAVTTSPTFGEITFTANPQPNRARDAFRTGVAKISATFEYDNLTPEDVWTQVWYHNGQEVSRSSQPWLEDASGVYEYAIEAGGEPLPEGRWKLEFYLNEELITSGSFEIKDDAKKSGASDDPKPEEVAKLFKLAYTKWDGEKHNLYVSDTEGSFERFVLRGGAGPSWSPDGRYIFFYGEEGVDHQYINGQRYSLTGVTNGIARLGASPLPANVSQLRLFQGHGWNDGTARWANVSPDGSMIAYDGDRGGGRRIYFLGTTANQQFRYEIIGEQADWSPDSQAIVYRSGRNNQTGLWISNRTDSGHRRITAGGTDSFPTWSPDGKTIAFSRDVGGNVDIYTVKPDGSDLTRLTDAPGHDTLPAFLPTGELIFRSARGGQWGIWKMRGDGSNQTQIIANAPVGPEWSFSKMGVLK